MMAVNMMFCCLRTLRTLLGMSSPYRSCGSSSRCTYAYEAPTPMGRRPRFRCLRPPTSSHSCELRIGSDCGNSIGTIGRLLAAYADGLIQGLDRLFIAENADHTQ